MKAAVSFALLACAFLAVGSAGEKTDVDPADPKGRPKWKAGQAASFALWHEGNKWHMRTTAPKNEVHQFGITMTIVKGSVGELKPVTVEKKGKTVDLGTWNKERTQFKFLLSSGKAFADGFDFDVSADATNIKFSLQIDGKDVPNAVFIGSKGDHPAKATFTLPANPGK